MNFDICLPRIVLKHVLSKTFRCLCTSLLDVKLSYPYIKMKIMFDGNLVYNWHIFNKIGTNKTTSYIMKIAKVNI